MFVDFCLFVCFVASFPAVNEAVIKQRSKCDEQKRSKINKLVLKVMQLFSKDIFMMFSAA